MYIAPIHCTQTRHRFSLHKYKYKTGFFAVGKGSKIYCPRKTNRAKGGKNRDTKTRLDLSLSSSLLSLHHDDVVAELGLDGRVGVDGVAEGGDGQGEGRVLERAHHRPAGHPTQGPTGSENV